MPACADKTISYKYMFIRRLCIAWKSKWDMASEGISKPFKSLTSYDTITQIIYTASKIYSEQPVANEFGIYSREQKRGQNVKEGSFFHNLPFKLQKLNINW